MIFSIERLVSSSDGMINHNRYRVYEISGLFLELVSESEEADRISNLTSHSS